MGADGGERVEWQWRVPEEIGLHRTDGHSRRKKSGLRERRSGMERHEPYNGPVEGEGGERTARGFKAA